jgi:MFS family permease
MMQSKSTVYPTPELVSHGAVEDSMLQRALRFGWGPILVGAMAMAATYPGRTHGLGMVTEPLLVDLKLDTPDGRVFYASLNFWGTLLGALFCLPVGWLFDRYDRRWILAGNMTLLGMCVLWMSTIQSWQELFASIILTRGLGQSALSVVSLTIVAKSFRVQSLGLAMAWFAILSAPFHLILIKGVGWSLTDGQCSWRQVWGAVGIALVALSSIAFFLKSTPRSVASRSDEIVQGSSLWQALRTPAFWVFSLTISLWGMIYAGVALFNQDIFKERGFDQATYFNVLSLVTVVALCSNFLFGWLITFVSLPRLLAACLMMTAMALTGLPMAHALWHVYAYGVCLGIASGAVSLLFFSTWRTLFGRKELGRIQGFAQMLTVFASASGPLIFSYCKRITSSYTSVFQVLAGIVCLMAVLAWLTPIPKSAPQVEAQT